MAMEPTLATHAGIVAHLLWSIFYGMSLLRANRMPARAARSSKRSLPSLGLDGSSCSSGSYGARVVCPPRRMGRNMRWLKRLRHWAVSIRQIVETVYQKLHNALGLRRERAHELQGLRACLAARVALHNFCIWLNEQLGDPRLTFADLLQ
jgi:hypothetical protein